MKNVNDFKKGLSSIATSAKNVRDKVQACMVFGIQHAVAHGDPVYLTMLHDVVSKARGLALYKLEGTIRENVDGLAWGQHKDGSMGYKKSKKTITCDIENLPHWSDFTKGLGKPKQPLDADAFAKRLKSLAKKAREAGIVKSVADFRALCINSMQVEGFGEVFVDEGVKVELDADGEPAN